MSWSLLMSLIGLAGMLVVLVLSAHSMGKQAGHRDTEELCDIADRLAGAIDDLDKWCGHTSPHARLIARHLTAIGLGDPLNAGTPCGDEACTIDGLREQLRRLEARTPPDGGAA